jgi:hypothetical protein
MKTYIVVGALAVSLTTTAGLAYFAGSRIERTGWLEKEKTRLETDVSDLVQQRNEISRLVELNKERQDEYLQALTLIDELKRRRLVGMRELELKADLERADADRLREYGLGATRVARSCIEEYRDLGVEAGGAAAVAKARRPLTKPTAPTPPTQVRK